MHGLPLEEGLPTLPGLSPARRGLSQLQGLLFNRWGAVPTTQSASEETSLSAFCTNAKPHSCPLGLGSPGVATPHLSALDLSGV